MKAPAVVIDRASFRKLRYANGDVEWIVFTRTGAACMRMRITFEFLRDSVEPRRLAARRLAAFRKMARQ